MTDKGELDILFGASSAIAGALIQRWQREGLRPILAVTRSAEALNDALDPSRVQVETSDYSEAALSALAARLVSAQTNVTRLVVCNGVLQGADYRPERALAQIDSAAMHTVFEVNTFLPMRVLSAMAPLLKTSVAPIVAALSARVGSLGDNHRGGWYSYRASKAALNMMLQCLAHELVRVNPSAKVVAYHPGTVDTPLSKPFQAGVRPETLLQPDQAAEALDAVLTQVVADGTLSYVDWRGEPIPW
jgi:NAD(P)-dependent dehydrogenase (short-subunit alcohol dehydrogenase family)